MNIIFIDFKEQTKYVVIAYKVNGAGLGGKQRIWRKMQQRCILVSL